MKHLMSALSILCLPQIFAICCLPGIVFFATNDSSAATVVQRGAVASRSAPRTNNTNRIAPAVIAPAVNQPVEEAEVILGDTVTTTEEIAVIENKSSRFDQVLDTVDSGSKDIAGDALSDMIRKQRAALDTADNQATAATAISRALANNQNSCDIGLRTCMQKKCDNDFSKCAGDGDTIWGDKMDACRRNLTCSGNEYRLFAVEIKADRDFNVKMGSYQTALDCGDKYNSCIMNQCGTRLNKCVGKTNGNTAIESCASIAKECQETDSGFASRTLQVFASLRNDVEVGIKKDEARLYALRDAMTSRCKTLGATFDQRSLDCVFSVEFFANNSATPYASKKSYGGSSFDCDQNWFGVDVTTFKENAYRLTREQTSATSALMGAGLGVAAGALTSGAIGRAVDTQKAKKAEKAAEAEHKAAKTAKSTKADTPAERQAAVTDDLKKVQDKQVGEIQNESTAAAMDKMDKFSADATSDSSQKNISDMQDLSAKEEARSKQDTPKKAEKSTKSDSNSGDGGKGK